MENKKIIIIITSVILIVLIISIGAYFIFNNKINIGNLGKTFEIPKTEKQLRDEAEKTAAFKRIEELKKTAKYIKGTITVLEEMSAKIKTDNGTEYTLWPGQPKSIYEFMEIKLGKTVEVWGEFLENNKFEVKFIQPI